MKDNFHVIAATYAVGCAVLHAAPSSADAVLVGPDDLEACVDAGRCAPVRTGSGGPVAEVPSLREAEAYVSWFVGETEGTARMATVHDLFDPVLRSLAAGMPPFAPLRIWLDGCRPAERFAPPSADRRRAFGLRPEGSERMNPSGQVFVGADCIECQLVERSSEWVETRWLYHAGPYRGVDFVVIEEWKDLQ
jgi:hypothetical protein